MWTASAAQCNQVIFPHFLCTYRQHENSCVNTEDLGEPLEHLQSDIKTRLIKAVATPSGSNATKRAKRRGGSADDQ